MSQLLPSGTNTVQFPVGHTQCPLQSVVTHSLRFALLLWETTEC